MVDERTQSHQQGNVGTGAQAATVRPVKLVTNSAGEIRFGQWETPPAGYTLVTGREEFISTLMNLNATELRQKIADLCLGTF